MNIGKKVRMSRETYDQPYVESVDTDREKEMVSMRMDGLPYRSAINNKMNIYAEKHNLTK